jgi:hypothetical protein
MQISKYPYIYTIYFEDWSRKEYQSKKIIPIKIKVIFVAFKNNSLYIFN